MFSAYLVGGEFHLQLVVVPEDFSRSVFIRQKSRPFTKWVTFDDPPVGEGWIKYRARSLPSSRTLVYCLASHSTGACELIARRYHGCKWVSDTPQTRPPIYFHC